MDNISIKNSIKLIVSKLNAMIIDLNANINNIFSYLSTYSKIDNVKKTQDLLVNNLQEILLVKNSVRNNAIEVIDNCVDALIKLPLSKDLRRVISYMQIARNIELSNNSLLTFYKFLINIKLSKTFAFISDDLLDILKTLKIATEILSILLENESVDQAIELKNYDLKVNKLYFNLFKAWPKITFNVKDKNAEQTLKKQYLLAIKSLEKVGDELKEFANNIVYIAIGQTIKEDEESEQI